MEEKSCSKHDLVFVKNLYGDEFGPESKTGKVYKSEWKCSLCGKTKYKTYYNKIEK